jgi:large subunit ribosomal protein L15
VPDELSLSNLTPASPRKARKRVGRGMGSGKGRYSGRGIKGQKARAGSHTMRAGFEGGQMPIYMRMGKQRGSTSKDAMPIGPHRTVSQGVNVRDLERVFEAGAEVTLEVLKEKRLIRSLRVDVKILGEGELTKGLTVTAHRFSQAAREKIEAAGGTVVALREPSETKSRKARKVAAAKRAAGIALPAEPDEAEETAAPDSPPEEPETD